MIFRLILMIVGVLFLQGCMGYQQHHSKPFKTYSNLTLKNEDTAIFVALDDRHNSKASIRIRSVDGTGTDCFTFGCPQWVRTTEGKHRIVITYTFPRWSYKEVATLDFEVNMQKGHTYVARYQLRDKLVSIKVDDLGVDADYGIFYGNGENRTHYPVTF
ncbi:MAG: hypothetical protein JKX76_03790 [Colwellia sp.]|nr:hypothetical protein [Colwellia sp.]